MSKKLEIPWVLGSERVEDEGYEATFKASQKHGKQLNKAEGDLSMARDFCETLRGHLIKEEAYTEVTVVDHIEKLINKALDLLSRHDSQYHNLFVAYFDLKGGAK